MVESAYCIEDVSIRKGDIVLNKDKNGNENDKDKNKPWNKNKYFVNDRVVDDPNLPRSFLLTFPILFTLRNN